MFASFDYDLFTVSSVLGTHPHPYLLSKQRFTSITTSSLEVQPSSLFVPLKGNRDGHDFIADALERGAAGFLVRKNHPILRKLQPNEKARAIAVADPVLALGALAAFHRQRFRPLVIGVTGSNGKTTTKDMLVQIFHHVLGSDAIGTEKNYNNHIGVPFTLFKIQRTTRVAIVEMGMNHAGEISYLSKLSNPHAALISSIGHAHIEFLGSRQNIARAKAEILDGMPRGAILYVPDDVAEVAILSRKARSTQAILRRVAVDKNPVFKTIAADARGYLLRFGKREIRFAHANAAWLSNLALAATVARDAGLTAEDIGEAVRKFRPPAGRMQVKRGHFTIIDDGYNANPDSAVASMKAALQLAEGKPVVCVFGDFKELGKFSQALHSWTGSEAARLGVQAFYGVGNAMRHAVASYRKAAPQRRSFHFAREQIRPLIDELRREKRGAVILVKGSRSMQMEEIVAALSIHA